MLDKILIVDMTHGGVKLATEFSKLNCDVFAWDIYHTLNKKQKELLQINNVELVDEDFITENEVFIVAPVHCNLEHTVHMTHHEAVAYLLKSSVNVPVIEVTGVKGKTSVVYMLKEIFNDTNPLILSSLGIEIEDMVLERDVSITPANIITAWELGQKYNPGIFIMENSLGGTGLASVGILTNIVEDYSIASGTKKASQAKEQIFKSGLVVCDIESYQKFYIHYREKTNTSGLTKGNVRTRSITYGLKESTFNVEVQGLKTISGEILHDQFQVETFAPAPHHVENALSAICVSLSCGKSIEDIKRGLKNFHGLKGRTSLKFNEDTVIIEEINPGINVTAVERALGMLKHLPRSVVIFGGQYGVTCEEIHEESVSQVLNKINNDIGLILTDELGAAIIDRIKRDVNYVDDLYMAVEYAKKHYQNILLIYRSNFLDIDHR